LAVISLERSLSQLVGQFGKLGMASSSITNMFQWWNGKQLSEKTLAWFASKLRRALLLLFLCGERVAYDVLLLYLGFISLVLCSPVHTYIEQGKNR
jgi:hypothetical protein